MKFLKKNTGIVAVIMLLCMFLLGLFSLDSDSGTTDEIAHIPAGYSYVKYFDYRLNPEHPPLQKAISGFPLLFMNLDFPDDRPAWTTDVNGQWESGWKFIYEYGNNPDLMFFWARLPILLYSLLLGISLFLWSRELFGKGVALFALFMFCFSPNILAHSRYVTTDLGVTASFFIMIYFFYKFIKNPSWKYLFWSGIMFGVAQLVKFSNIILVAYLVLLVAVVILAYRKRFKFELPILGRIKSNFWHRTLTLGTSLVTIWVIGFILVGAVYMIFVHKMPSEVQGQMIDEIMVAEENEGFRNILHSVRGNLVGKAYAHYALGLKMVFQRVAGGNTTYFFGETTNQSWWYYYPLSFLIKTPLATLGLLFFSLAYLAYDFYRKFRREKIRYTNKRWSIYYGKLTNTAWKFFPEIIIVSVMITFMAAGITSNLNIGLRHVLPMYPFMFILIAKYFVGFVRRHKYDSRGLALSRKGLFVAVAGYLLFTNLFNYPYYLAYFNEAIGRDNGYKYTVDSNIDWGQDLKRLATYVKDNDIKKIKVDYFGGSVPSYYLGDRFQQWRSSDGETTGWLAVSATYYQNSKYYADNFGEKDYRWLEKYEPVTIIGGSILVYNILEK